MKTFVFQGDSITDAGRAALPGEEASGEDDRFSALTGEQQDQLAALLRALCKARRQGK